MQASSEFVYTIKPTMNDRQVGSEGAKHRYDNLEADKFTEMLTFGDVEADVRADVKAPTIESLSVIINDIDLVKLSSEKLANKTCLEKRNIKAARDKIKKATADLARLKSEIKEREDKEKQAKREAKEAEEQARRVEKKAKREAKEAEEQAKREAKEQARLAKEQSKEEAIVARDLAKINAVAGVQAGDDLFGILIGGFGKRDGNGIYETYRYNLDNCFLLGHDDVFTEHFDVKALTFIVNRIDKAKSIIIGERVITQDNCDVHKYLRASVKTRGTSLDVNSISVTYRQKKFKGKVLCYRHNALYALSGQNMVREIRHCIHPAHYVDIDLVNCHPNIVKWVCMKIGIECDVVIEYTINRQKHIDDLLLANPKATKGDIKTLFIRIMYGCGEKASNFFDKDYTRPIIHTEFSKTFRSEFGKISRNICKKFPEVYEFTKLYKDEKAADKTNESGLTLKGYNYEGSTVSYICCFFEDQLMLRIVEYLRVNHPHAAKECILCFDGCMVHIGGKHGLTMAQINTMIDLINRSLVSQGCDMFEFIIKPMDNSLLDKLGYNPEDPIEELILDSCEQDELNSFDEVFKSDRNKSLLCNMLNKIGSNFDKFRYAVTDREFAVEEDWCWVDKHIVIKNNLTNVAQVCYNDFEKLIKSIRFDTYKHACRFLIYFLQEVFIFTNANTRTCYYRVSPTKDHPECLMEFPMERFHELSITYGSRGDFTKMPTRTVLSNYPYHKFDNTAYLWDQDSSDKSIMSLAEPFKIKIPEQFDEVSEADLPPILMEYFIDVLCSGDEQRWIWVRSYLANIILKPDEKTGVMLILYSLARRCGKSSLGDLLKPIMGSSNIGLVDNLKDAFGERGAYAHIGKKLLWLEEVSGAGDNNNFRDCMNRMKTYITDPDMTTRAMCQGARRSRNYFEFIACTNNMIGVLEDRTTVISVSAKHRGDRVWFAELKSHFTPEILTKLVCYLSKYTVSNPMKILSTEMMNTMLNNCDEPIKEFVDDLPLNQDIRTYNHRINKYHPVASKYIVLSELYQIYTTWCTDTGVHRISQGKMSAKILHYRSDIKFEQIKHDDKQGTRVLTIQVDFIKVEDPIDEIVNHMLNPE
jgi:hypothetical protein